MQSATAIHEYTERLGEDARAITDDVIDLVTETQTFAKTQMQTRPYTTLGVALGIGYLMGAGIPRWFLRAAIPVITRAVATSISTTITQGYDSQRNRTSDISSGHQKETAP